MTKTVSYIIGVLAILFAVYVVVVAPPHFLIYPDLPELPFLERAFFVLILCVVLCFYRIVKGPTSPDRLVAVDMLGMLIIGFCAIFTISTGRSWYIDIGIAWALQSFITMLAFGKYYEGKDFDE
ncbi:MAG: cation:proton antiporter [Candidatus Omnitrophica bacterium]|nr:cation:proton antiporter [Candidatus Omnitrophota bacterium]